MIKNVRTLEVIYLFLSSCVIYKTMDDIENLNEYSSRYWKTIKIVTYPNSNRMHVNCLKFQSTSKVLIDKSVSCIV